MAAGALARRYARAYFDLAVEAGKVAAWGRELQQVAERIGDERARTVLLNPRTPLAERVKLAQALAEGTAAQTRNLVRLLVERNRLDLLPGIAEDYERLADEHSGVVRAEIITALPVDDRLRTQLTGALRQKLGTEVKTEVRQDPEILGGLIIRIGDRVIDASVRTRLQRLQAALA